MSLAYRDFADAVAARAGRAARGPTAFVTPIPVFAAGCFALFCLAGWFLLRGPTSGPPGETTAPAAAAPAWIEDAAGPRLFALQPGAFGAAAGVHRVRRQTAGAGRIEQIVFGAPQGGPYLRVSVYRAADGAAPGASFWLEMARRAGEAGFALEKTPGVPDVVPTRLGAFHMGELRLRGAEGLRVCHGFRLEASDPPVVISGFGCHDAVREGAREALACALETLSVVDPAVDPALAALVARPGPSGCRERVLRPARDPRR